VSEAPSTETAADAAKPSAAEIRGALARLIASDALRASPQLSAFLTFVVDAELRGESKRIKGYTIGVEALGRAQSFDPQVDSIVRVVAGRLRRALERHYAQAEIDRSVIIELPRGTYVPQFKRGIPSSPPAAPAHEEAEAARLAPGPAPALAAPRHERKAGEAPRRWLARPGSVYGALFGAVILGAIGLAFVATRPEAGARLKSWFGASPAPTARAAPVIFVEPFEAIGTSSSQAFAIGPLRSKISEAMARFDGINIATEAPAAPQGAKPPAWSEYRFTGRAEYHEDGATTLGFRLVDTADGTVIWSRIFPKLRADDKAGAVEGSLLREVVSTIAQPFGVVWTRELTAHGVTDQRRACLLEAIEYWRSFNPARHEPVRQCLERLVAEEPRYAPAYSGLGLVYLRDFYLDITRPGEAPALDRALQFAKHAVELRPHSARAQESLSAVWFARGEIALSFRAAKRAIELNPYDTNVLADYGAHLVATGDVVNGLAILDDAAAHTEVGPSWFEFYRFLGRYLSGDLSGAARHASMIIGTESLHSALAHALIESRAGQGDRAKRAVDRLIALNPAWRTEPRRELAKFFPSTEIQEQLLRDLKAAGLPAAD
jgi:tetratricopeptide (TPR) repeat protein